MVISFPLGDMIGTVILSDILSDFLSGFLSEIKNNRRKVWKQLKVLLRQIQDLVSLLKVNILILIIWKERWALPSVKPSKVRYSTIYIIK